MVYRRRTMPWEVTISYENETKRAYELLDILLSKYLKLIEEKIIIGSNRRRI